MSELNVRQRQDVREAIERPESVLMLRLTTTDGNVKRDVAVANIHVTWSQLKYPALQALQVSLSVCHYRSCHLTSMTARSLTNYTQ